MYYVTNVNVQYLREIYTLVPDWVDIANSLLFNFLCILLDFDSSLIWWLWATSQIHKSTKYFTITHHNHVYHINCYIWFPVLYTILWGWFPDLLPFNFAWLLLLCIYDCMNANQITKIKGLGLMYSCSQTLGMIDTWFLLGLAEGLRTDYRIEATIS